MNKIQTKCLTLLKHHGNVENAISAVKRDNPDQRIINELKRMLILFPTELNKWNHGTHLIHRESGTKYMLMDYNGWLVNLADGSIAEGWESVYPLEVYKYTGEQS